MITAREAAKYLLTLDNSGDGDFMSNLKLQKLLYYAQGVHLALHGTPLFPDPIEAWDHGPVCPEVYRAYKQFGGNALPPPPGFKPMSLPQRARNVLNEVHRVFGQFAAWRLREMTHSEPPWKATFREGKRNVRIPTSVLKSYFDTVVTRG